MQARRSRGRIQVPWSLRFDVRRCFVIGSVLIVDDDNGCGRLLAVLVRHLGHHATYVQSGGQALEYLGENRPDLVILDVMMPGMDGLEVLRRMREDPRTEQVPVVMFSALADPRFRQRVREQGANDYWVKASVDFQQLEKRLEEYLPPQTPHN